MKKNHFHQKKNPIIKTIEQMDKKIKRYKWENKMRKKYPRSTNWNYYN